MADQPTPKPAEEILDLDTLAPKSETPVVDKDKEKDGDAEQPQIFNAARPDDAVREKLSSITSPLELLDAINAIAPDKLIPWETLELPSRGLYYDGKIPGGLVRAKAMGTFADKILATARLAQSGQSIDYLLKNLVQLPNDYPAEQLLAGDRTFLLYALRGITHGGEYEFMIACPNCESTQSCQYNLNDLQSTITYGNPTIVEPAKVTLPYLSSITGKDTWVTVRFMRGKDISVLAQRQKFNKRVQGASIKTNVKAGPGVKRPPSKAVVIDNALTENLNLIITSFMGVTDVAKIATLVEKLHSSDTAAIREFLRKYSPGIDTTITVTCIDCSNEFKTELPITESFFRPAERRGVRP